jgi:hypothetical protein
MLQVASLREGASTRSLRELSALEGTDPHDPSASSDRWVVLSWFHTGTFSRGPPTNRLDDTRLMQHPEGAKAKLRFCYPSSLLPLLLNAVACPVIASPAYLVSSH